MGDDLLDIKEKVDYIFTFCKQLEMIFGELSESPQGQMMARMTGIDVSKIGQ